MSAKYLFEPIIKWPRRSFAARPAPGWAFIVPVDQPSTATGPQPASRSGRAGPTPRTDVQQTDPRVKQDGSLRHTAETRPRDAALRP